MLQRVRFVFGEYGLGQILAFSKEQDRASTFKQSVMCWEKCEIWKKYTFQK
jgi:hypothetical protein